MAMPPSLTRWSGPASIMGAVLLVAQIALSSVLGPAQSASNPYEIYSSLHYAVYNVLFDTALLLFAAGLIGFHTRRAPRSGWLGKTGLFLALITGALAIVSVVTALLVGLWPQLAIQLSFFTQLLALACLISV